MTYEQKVILIGGILIIAVIVICTLGAVAENKKRKRLGVSSSAHSDTKEAPSIFRAEIIDMHCGVNTVGEQNYKQPKAVKYFTVTFKKDNGDIFDIAVTEEMYAGLDVGLSGTLSLIGGELYSFEADN